MLLKLLHNFFIIGFSCPNPIWKAGSSRTEYSSLWYTKTRDCSDVVVLLAFMGRKAQKMHRSYKQHSWKNCFCSSIRHPTHPLMELSQNFLHRKQLLFHLSSLMEIQESCDNCAMVDKPDVSYFGILPNLPNRKKVSYLKTLSTQIWYQSPL